MNKQSKVLLFITLLCIIGCKSDNKDNSTNGIPIILTTTGMVKDAVINLVGEEADVNALMGPGVDPHLYQASPGDLSKMNKADLIVYNGLYLEGKLNDILKKLGANKNVINFSDAINKENLLDVVDAQYKDEIYDPHIWFGIDIWKQGIVGLSKQLIELYPDLESTIQQNSTSYLEQLDILKIDLLAQMSTVPKEKRIMVTSHDAFKYFGRMLDIRVEALQGISTATDFGLQDRKHLVDLIVEEDISAIFIESSVGDKPIKAIISDCKKRGNDISLGGTLFSDAMGEEGSPEGTYIGMLKHNVAIVVKGLSNEK